LRAQSAKAKGRRAQQAVCKKIVDKFDVLSDDDVQSRGMGGSGEDIMLSPLARSHFPFSTEVKNQERLNIWEAIKQAQSNSGNHIPLVVFTRNREDMYATLKFDDLLRLL
jgi:hypothetical protein